MNSSTRLQFAALLLIALLFPFSAQANLSAQGQAQPAASRLQRTVFPRPAAQIDAELRDQAGQLSVVIELEDTPSALSFAQAQRSGLSLQATQTTAQRQLAQVERAQQRLLAPLSQLGAQVLYRTQRVYNGIAARVDASKLDQIARLPGVKAVHRLVKHRMSLSSSVPLIGAPELWEGIDLPSGLTGDGIDIAIIDSGVDYIHVGLGGSGLQADYDRNNPASIGETPALFPTTRVVGGYDFAGDAYNGGNTPQPDPDPMDCNGHGSHVAGIAAGNGVLEDGSAYSASYNTNTHNLNFRIGPGVAPEARIYALKVFGCDGYTELVSQAIEWAVDPNGDGNFGDRVDVINMSLGSDFGYDNDATSVAANNAVMVGTIVVASAGNDGDTTFITGSPGTASRVISVASSVDATDIFDGFRENSPTATVRPAMNSVAYDWDAMAAPVTADLVYPPTQRTGCEAFSAANTALIAGKIVLLDWTDDECGSVARGANLVAAGAAGGILVDNSDIFDLFITGSAVIPMVSAPKAVGDALKIDLGLATVNVTLDKQYIASVPYTDPNQLDTLSSFSSRGPRRDGSVLKPDIAAPGHGIFSVNTGTGDGGISIDGTSMAAPHIAGAMALLRQLHPTWTIEELKALVMNTAVNNLRSDLPASAALLAPMRVGAGRVDLPRAAANEVLAYTESNEGLVSVSFGNVEVLGTTTLTRTVNIVNKGATPVTYNLAYVPATTVSGVSYSLSAASVTIAAGGSTTVDVIMSADAAQMKHAIDPTLSPEQSSSGAEIARPWLSEASGYLALTTSGPATQHFTAWIGGNQENPATGSAVTATATFTYTAATNQIDYEITFTKPITLTAAHFHSAPAGRNGPVVIPIPTGDSTFVAGESLTGSAAVSPANLPLLLSGGLYVNFHTAAYPGGEIRGQVVPSLDDTALRLPIYANARPASDMSAVGEVNLNDTAVTTATLELTGSGVNTGANYPYDTVSLVSAFELQHSSPNEASSNADNDEADLAYVGVASNVASTSAFTETVLYFGIATHGDWSTPNQVEFDIFIDTDRDGEDDFVLFNSNLGWMSLNDQNDLMLTFLLDLETDDIYIQGFVNGLSPEEYDTALFNSNVLVLPVFAEDLGLTAVNSRFNYRVESFSLDSSGSEPSASWAIAGREDQTPTLTFDAAHPGIDTSGGAIDRPIYRDLPAEELQLTYNHTALTQSGSRGVLLLHHMNKRGERAQVLLSDPPVSEPALNVIGSSSGKPGSYFSLEAQGFAPEQELRITVDGQTVLTQSTDTDGRLRFVLYFSSVAPQRSYTVIATSVAEPTQSAQTQVTIDNAATLLPRPEASAGPVIKVLPELYFPAIWRQ